MKVAEMSVLSVSRPMYLTSKRALSMSLTGGLLGSTESTGWLPWPPALHATFMPSACVQVDRSQWTLPGEGCETQRCLFLCPPPCLSCTAADGDYVCGVQAAYGPLLSHRLSTIQSRGGILCESCCTRGRNGRHSSICYVFIHI